MQCHESEKLHSVIKNHTPFQSLGHNKRMGLQGKSSFPVTDLQFFLFQSRPCDLLWSQTRDKSDLELKVHYFQSNPHFIPFVGSVFQFKSQI